MSTKKTSAKNEAVIKAMTATFAKAWNAKDAKHLSTLFASDNHMTIADTQIKFLTPDIAVLHSTWETSG